MAQFRQLLGAAQSAALEISEEDRARLVLEAKVKGYLRDAPGLAAHMHTLVVGNRAARLDKPRVDGGGEQSPLPLNPDAFDDLNTLYADLVNWATMWARIIEAAPPASVLRQYRTDEDCKGLPLWATPADTRVLVRDVTRWLLTGFDLIMQERSASDYLNVLSEEFRELFGKYPTRIKKRKLAAECPSCGRRTVTVERDAAMIDPGTGKIITVPALVACTTCFDRFDVDPVTLEQYLSEVQ